MADDWDKAQHDAAPNSAWAVPGKKKLRIDDEKHTRLAWDMVDRTNDLTDAERAEARRRILRRAKEIGLDTSDWEKTARAATLSIAAMALDMPAADGHPNRMPFSGILTRLDQPSDMPVGGAGGKRTVLPRAVAEAALPSLLGMAVDFAPGLDGHDVKRKIGIITAATIEGDAVKIEGFLYSADFPAECERIKAEKNVLGLSMEIQAQTVPDGDLLRIVGGTFTGAAILRKDKAAYQTTSLAASTAGDIEMTKDELTALLAVSLGPLSEQLNALGTKVQALEASGATLHANKEMRDRIAPHAAKLRDCAAAMEAAGIGLHSERGHVRVLHHMAASMEADAARGHLPHIYRDHDWNLAGAAAEAAAATPAPSAELKALMEEVKALGTKVTDLKAEAFRASAAPQRRTLSAEGAALLRKTGLRPDTETGKIRVGDLDQAIERAGMNRTSSIALKLALQGAGQLA